MSSFFTLFHVEYCNRAYSDDYYGKDRKVIASINVVACEAEVKDIVDRLNEKNHSTYPMTKERSAEILHRIDEIKSGARYWADGEPELADDLQQELRELREGYTSDPDYDYWYYEPTQVTTLQAVCARYHITYKE